MAISAVKRANKQKGKKGDAKKGNPATRGKSDAGKFKPRKTGSTVAAAGGGGGGGGGGKGRSNKNNNSSKKNSKAPVVDEHSNSEGELSDQDISYFNEAELKEFGFLSTIDTKSLTNLKKDKRKKKQQKVDEPTQKQQSDSDEYESGTDDEDTLATYEEAPRQGDWSKQAVEQGRQGLPIKLPDGRVRRGAMLENKAESTDEEEAEEEKELAKKKELKEKRLQEKKAANEEALLASRLDLRSKKEKLASIAQSILADPEGQISKLKLLKEMTQDADEKSRKLVYLTQMAVYKDIAPGYRIRELTEQERTAKVTAELRKLRKYEETLVFYYRAYIDSLLREAKGGDVDTSPGSMSFIVTKCICTLLSHLPHFNFRSELIKALTQRLAARRWSEVSVLSRDTIVLLFREDASGEISLEIVKQITQMVKKRDYNVHPQVLATFFHLRLRDELQQPVDDSASSKGKTGKSKKEKVHFTKQERKRRRVQKEVEHEMREAEAEYSREERERMFNDTLKMVFVTYFRVLKQGNTSPLLPAVLEGLAKFAHLISVDYFEDLLALLKRIMQLYHPDHKPVQQTLTEKKTKRRNAKLIGGDNNNNNSNDNMEVDNDNDNDEGTNDKGDAVRMPLLCLITISQILSGHGEALNYDLKEFYALLYTLLFPVAMKASASEAITSDETKDKLANNKRKRDDTAEAAAIEADKKTRAATDSELVMRGLDALLLQRKHVPVERVASFLKRMAMVSLHMSPTMAVHTLERIRTVMTRKQQLDALLSDEEGRMGNGVYQAALDDPDLCNPMATNLWELALLKDHYDPKVRQTANTLLRHTATSATSHTSGSKNE